MANLKLTPVVPAGSTMPARPSATTGKAGGGFGQVLTKAVDAVNQNIEKADDLATKLASGQKANIQETMIAAEKADISFRLLATTQSKVIAAYQEIMRLQL